nr:MAG TPA: hypothetical protein [Caudoviricetes sp.]
MTHGIRKIQIQDPNSDGTEDIKLYYSTITDNVGITCGEQDVFLTQDQFKALAYLIGRCFYTRDMLIEMQAAIICCVYPYNVFSSHDGKTWKLEVEKDRYD